MINPTEIAEITPKEPNQLSETYVTKSNLKSSVEGGPSWSAVGRCCHTRKKNSRRTPCTLPTVKRRLDAIRKKDSATVYTVEKKRP